MELKIDMLIKNITKYFTIKILNKKNLINLSFFMFRSLYDNLKEKFDTECLNGGTSTYRSSYTTYVAHVVGILNQTFLFSVIEKYASMYRNEPFLKRTVEGVFGALILEGNTS